MNFREDYKNETGENTHQYGGVPNEEYVEWLEAKLFTQKQSATEQLQTKIAAGLEHWCGYCKDECPKDNERCEIPSWARELRTL